MELIKKMKRSVTLNFIRTWQYHLLLLPGMALLIIFSYIPLAGLAIAFQDFKPGHGLFGSDYIGFQWFKYMTELPDIWNVTRNTVIIAALKIVIGFPIPIIFALLLNEVKLNGYKKAIQTIIYLPHFLSWVILSGLIMDVFSLSGLVNQVLMSFGADPIYFLGSNLTFRPLIIGSDIWKNFGWGTVIYMAALSGIDSSLYESASLDGAGRWRQTIHITLPGITNIIILTGILSLGNILNAGFEQIFNMYNPLVMKTGDIIDTYVYRLAFIDASWSLSTAVGLIKSVVSTIFISVGYWLAYKFTDYKIF